MHVSKIVLLILFLCSVVGCTFSGYESSRSSQTIAPQNPSSLQRGVDYLLSQQSDDGLWRSPNYGNLRDGAAMTAFVLYSLGDHPVDEKANLQAGVDALLPMIRDRGFVTNPDGPDYTNYGSAMLLVAAERMGLTLPDDAKDKLQQYLIRSQLDREEGYQPGDADFGGWDLSGWMTGERPTSGTNISVSTEVVEALTSSDGAADTLSRATTWILRVRNDIDGGFFFHPKKEHDGNKAGWTDGDGRQKTRSYGSATADGLRFLTALGKTKSDDDVKAAIAWLKDKPDLTTVPGFSHEQGEGSWAYGLRYYYYQSLSRSLSLFAEEDGRRMATAITEILTKEQNADGSWTNPNARMREDDPLIATGFAITALRHCQNYLEMP